MLIAPISSGFYKLGIGVHHLLLLSFINIETNVNQLHWLSLGKNPPFNIHCRPVLTSWAPSSIHLIGSSALQEDFRLYDTASVLLL